MEHSNALETLHKNYLNQTVEELLGVRAKYTPSLKLAASATSGTKLSDFLDDAKDTPSPSTIVAVPQKIHDDVKKAIRDIGTLLKYIDLVSNIELFKKLPNWRTLDRITLSNKRSDSVFYVLTAELAGILNQTNEVAQSINKQVTAAYFHTDFLKSLFQDFGFPESVINGLDGMFTNAIKQLQNVEGSWENSTKDLSLLIIFYYFEDVPSMKDVKIPKVRLFNLKISNNSWKLAVGINSSVGMLNFSVSYTDHKYDFNRDAMDKHRDALNDYTNELITENLLTMDNIKQPSIVITP